ncbi:dienelactone hydrolase family protein [soil metagenome]
MDRPSVGRRGLGLAAAVLLGLAWTGVAAVAGETVEFEGGKGPIKGYLAKPEGNGPFPAILVIHEWWGLADWIKQNADHFAEQGYVALAVDLYDGKVTDDPGEAHELMRALDDGEAIADLKGAVRFLRSHEAVDQDQKLGAIGWCMGGKFSRLIAQNSEEIGPTAICYGSVATEPDQIKALSGDGRPVLGIFGGDDRGIPVDRVKQFASALADQGSDVSLYIYEGAGHAFMLPGGRQHDEPATENAWKQIDEFFQKTLHQTNQ